MRRPHAPTAPSPRASLCFAVRGRDLLVAEGAGAPRVPSLGEVEPLGLGSGLLHVGVFDGVECVAVPLPDETEAPGGMTFQALRPLAALLPRSLFGVAGRAVQIVEWDETHRFCGRCGTPTEPAPNERAKRCPACRLAAFPRVSPAVIVRVARRDEILLARNRRFPEPIYSVVAGFVDPGESLEEAVAREVREESGVEVRRIRYFGSQPWPFPHSLMVGFTAEHAGGEIRVDGDEIVDAAWFRADALPRIPPSFSIARRLIDDWARSAG